MLVTAQLIGIPGTQAIGLASLALGLGWVVICLNAMRVGLLTRFMGVLGIICGALIVLPILSPLPIVQTFWLGAMALLLVGPLAQRASRPRGPPARRSRGRRSRRRARRAARDARLRRRSRSPIRSPRQRPATAARTPSSRKKKRKRRA